LSHQQLIYTHLSFTGISACIWFAKIHSLALSITEEQFMKVILAFAITILGLSTAFGL
jgi:hypothetical protein